RRASRRERVMAPPWRIASRSVGVMVVTPPRNAAGSATRAPRLVRSTSRFARSSRSFSLSLVCVRGGAPQLHGVFDLAPLDRHVLAARQPLEWRERNAV